MNATLHLALASTSMLLSAVFTIQIGGPNSAALRRIGHQSSSDRGGRIA